MNRRANFCSIDPPVAAGNPTSNSAVAMRSAVISGRGCFVPEVSEGLVYTVVYSPEKTKGSPNSYSYHMPVGQNIVARGAGGGVV